MKLGLQFISRRDALVVHRGGSYSTRSDLLHTPEIVAKVRRDLHGHALIDLLNVLCGKLGDADRSRVLLAFAMYGDGHAGRQCSVRRGQRTARRSEAWTHHMRACEEVADGAPIDFDMRQDVRVCEE